MKKGKQLALVAGLAAALALPIASGAPAQASGDTSREHGCAAHWRVTAAWNECINPRGVTLQLQVECKWQSQHFGTWNYVNSSKDPVSRHECRYQAYEAYNGFRF